MSEDIQTRPGRSNSLRGPGDALEAYVNEKKGTRVIRKILIASNGMAAVKAIRSMRQWLFNQIGDENAIEFVVMATPEDLAANVNYVRLADAFVEVPGGSNNNNYANVELIVDISERFEVDAVWAGWGHASENPKLPTALAARNIAFLGPNADAMIALGDKIGSTLIAQHANVPTIPWSGSGLKVDYKATGMPDDVYRKACVESVEETMEVCERIGLPVMIKASEGGGGKGIRKVTEMDDVASAFRQVQGEVPGSPIFVMKLATGSRHLEVQVVADKYGNAIAIYGRDCSVQRRHQKIIEEGPVTAAPADVWSLLEKAAVRLALEVGYESAGTVEYLYSEDGYAFLELNPRLQVEHPVTEGISGVNVPAVQLCVAMGIPLYCIPEIRRLYQQDEDGSSSIDFETSVPRPPKGHVIAARITAENPDEGFRPTSGAIREVSFKSTPSCWGYFSVNASSGGVHEFADSQFGHLFAHGETRESARRNMCLALKELSITGDIRTTTEYLINLMEAEDFRNNRFDTAWLDGLIANKNIDEQLPKKKPKTPFTSVICGAVYKAYTHNKEHEKEFLAQLGKGRVPTRDLMEMNRHDELILNNVKYVVDTRPSGLNSYIVTLNRSSVDVEIRILSDGAMLVSVDGKSHVVFGTEEPSGLRLTVNSQTVIFSKEYDPTQLSVSMTGKLVRYLVPDGAHVVKGTPYVELEVMKMYIQLVVPEDGVITSRQTEGAMLEAGTTLATMELDDPSMVKRADMFTHQLPVMKPPHLRGTKPHQLLRYYLSKAGVCLLGYSCDVETIVDNVFTCLSNPRLPLLELEEIMAAVSARIPKKSSIAISKEIAAWECPSESESITAINAKVSEFMSRIKAIVKEGDESGDLSAVAMAPIKELAEQYQGGLSSNQVFVLTSLMDDYLSVEKQFSDGNTYEDVVDRLRDSACDPSKIFRISLSHHNVKSKNIFLARLMERLARVHNLGDYLAKLNEVAALSGMNYAEISLKARQVLIEYELPSFQERLDTLQRYLLSTISASKVERQSRLQSVINRGTTVFDCMSTFLFSDNLELRKLALEIFVSRAYKSYRVTRLDVADSGENATWNFLLHQYDQSGLTLGMPLGSLAGAKHSSSLADLANLAADTDDVNKEEFSRIRRQGHMFTFKSMDQLKASFPDIIKKMPESPSEEKWNIIYLAAQTTTNDDEVAIRDQFSEYLADLKGELRGHHVRTVTLMLCRQSQYPSYYTFRDRAAFQEDLIYRHVEPPMAYQLDLKRLSNFSIQFYPYGNRQIHVYFAEELKKSDANVRGVVDRRFFVRCLIRQANLLGTNNNQLNAACSGWNEGERVFVEALNALELAMGDSRFPRSIYNHVYLNFLPDAAVQPNDVEAMLHNLVKKYGKRARRLRVTEVEIRLKIAPPRNNRLGTPNSRSTYRFMTNNPTGHVVNIESYKEEKGEDGTIVLRSVGGSDNSARYNNMSANSPYQPLDKMQRKRIVAENNNTTYVYDFLMLFEHRLEALWWNSSAQKSAGAAARKPLQWSELVLDDNDRLIDVGARPVGQNTVGMVAFRLTMRTPEFPWGREVIIIANDITFQNGSFGPREDLLFKKVSEVARQEGLPRIYLAANSGARIGLAEEVKECFKIKWVDNADPLKGFEYLYLNRQDYDLLSNMESVLAEPVELDGQTVFKIQDIIGVTDGLGVENLRGSGMIAGETSQAYDEIFTLTYVTCRTVGIGAYLVRLGQRAIQNNGPPIILTGFSALNKLLGKEVYTSNMQLGGPKIMYTNGVSHLTVNDDFEGVKSILNWLSYLPERSGAPLPVIESHDPPARDIEFKPPSDNTPYDPRLMLAGNTTDDGKWVSGFFDRNSFTETLGGWAKTVITGRARLGGVPMGVIAVEVRSVEAHIPADPANPNSNEQVLQQAGQVWFPDSAYKTAQTIQDLNQEELPLMLFANWRGFSGGMRDMFDEILKFGSYIVDNLRKYRQPVFVYIPPGGELRGGAWVVVDNTINPDMMEMYADPSARGGVLEPTGTIEIKFRKPDLIRAMHRVDPTLQSLDDAHNRANASGDNEAVRDAAVKIAKRESELYPIYQQVAVHFADLHDTPGRMKAKGAIKDAIPWTRARSFFHSRLIRRLKVEDVRKQIQAASTTEKLSHADCIATVQRWFCEDNTVDMWDNDARVIEWFEQQSDAINNRLTALRRAELKRAIRQMVESDPEGFADAMRELNMGDSL